MTQIKISSSFNLPITLATMKSAYMGGNGSGKTYAAKKIIEEILKNNGWVIILDPVGVHYGIRLTEDRKQSKFNIPVLGGLYGDMDITPESGALIADVLCDKRISAVLDVSLFEDSELNRFSTDFAKRFFMNMKKKPRPVTLVMEECQEFIPQIPMKGEERKVHAFNKLVKIGRNHGIGVMMISPRPQDISKKSLNTAQAMFAFQMTGTQEREAIASWFKYQGNDLNIKDILPILEIGQPFLTIPRLGINQKVKFGRISTYDSSATPDFDEGSDEPVTLGTIDISKLEKEMKSLVQETKDNNPALLKQKVIDLQKQLDYLQTRPSKVTVQEKIVEKIVKEPYPAITEAEKAVLLSVQTTLNKLLETLSKPSVANSPLGNAQKGHVSANLRTPTEKYALKPSKPIVAAPESEEISKGGRSVLVYLAMLGSCTRAQLKTLTGYKTSSIDTYLRNLPKGTIEISGKYIEITQYGRDLLGHYDPAPIGSALREHWMKVLSAGQLEYFKAICEAYPNAIKRSDITTFTPYAVSSRDTYIRQLAALNLIEDLKNGTVRAYPELFD